MKMNVQFRSTAFLLGVGLASGALSGATAYAEVEHPMDARPPITIAQHPAPDITPLPPIYEPSDERSTVGEFISDAVLSTRVRAALAKDDALDGVQIDVSTDQGVVILSGQVASESMRARAIEIAAGVEGVREVHGPGLKVE